MAAGGLRLGTLLEDRSLGLQLLTSEDGTGRPVDGAHAIELIDAGRYLEPNWIVLTTGLAFHRSVARQEAFVHGLVDADAAAIGFGIDVMVHDVPAGLLRAALETNTPLFTVPAETTFSRIVQRVMTDVLHGAGPQMSRLLAMQERLVGLIDAADPEEAVMAELASMLGATGGIVADQLVLTEVGAAPWSELLEQVAAGHGYRAAPDGFGICVPVGADEADRRFLALAVPRGPASAYARTVARFAAVVLQMAATGRRVAAEQEQAVRCALLLDLVEAPRLTTELVERSKAFGFDPAQPVRCAVFRGCGDEAVQAAVTTALDRFFGDRRLARLVSGSASEVIAAWQGSYTGGGLLDALSHLADADQVAGGVGPVACLREGDIFASAVAGARAAALQVTDEPGTPRLTSYEELAYCDLVISFIPPADHRAAPSPLEVLRQDKSDLLGTLCSYFDHQLDVAACAKALNLHPNSLRYRLTRIEERLGRPLRAPSTIADLYLALRAERVHGEPPERALTVAARHAARSQTPLV